MTAHEAVPTQVLVLCERLDIAAFIDVYIKYLRNQGVSIPKVRIINLQCLDNLPQYLQDVKEEELLSEYRKVVLFADAGTKRLETEHFLYSVKQHSFLVDVDYDLYLFPKKSAAGNWSLGFMEDLLVPALKQETSECCYFYNLHNIAHEYIFSVNNSRGKGNRLVNYSRNFLYGYFAGTERFVGLRLGEAAAKGAFDLDHEGFKGLRKFLETLGNKKI